MRLKKQTSDGAVATVEQTSQAPKKKKSKKKIVWIVIAAVVVVLIGLRLVLGGGKQQEQVSAYTQDAAQTRKIISTLTGKGTLKPADAYTVTSLIKGEVVTADFEEGDKVTKDTVLYVVDSTDATTGLSRAQNALEQAQRAYNSAQESLADLRITAPAAGKVLNLDLKVGDTVSPGQTICTVRDNSAVTVKLPFPTDEAASFYVGQAASVTLDGSFETLPGRITEISGADEVLSGNRIVRRVTIEVQNPGAITNATQATATVGSSACAASGTFTYRADKTIVAKVGGDVASIHVSEGQSVADGQVILSLSSTNLSDTVENARSAVEDAQLSLNNQTDVLDGYTIKSPIDGTVIEKNYKQGDNLESGKQLCIIYDLDYLEFTMNIDELDINSVSVGQKVSVAADAADGKAYEGTVTKVSINGVTTNGVTTYPVTVRLESFDGLLPGMNVDATIIVAQTTGSVSIPVEALQRGNRVLVKTGADTDAPIEPGIPAGFNWVQVEVGISDDNFIEVTSGISEGDTVAYKQTAAPKSDMFAMMMGGPNASASEAPPEGGGPGGE